MSSWEMMSVIPYGKVNNEQDDTITACNSISAGNPNKWFITENGLYELLMKTDKPIAKQFKKES
jgi:prophage antirepressor-like protein